VPSGLGCAKDDCRLKPLPFGRVPGYEGDVDVAREDTGEGDRCLGPDLGLTAKSSSLSELCSCKSCRDSLILALSRLGRLK